MGFFRRHKSDGLDDSPFTAAEREHVDVLWRLTALPRDEFRLTYEAMLGNAWQWVDGGTGETWAGLKRDALASVIGALRARQARIIPRFAPAEDASRVAEVMSFALAAAVLAERLGRVIGRAAARGWCPWTEDVPAAATLQDLVVPRSYGALLLPRLVGERGRQWLSQEPTALQELAAFFGPEKSELRDIAAAAADRIKLPDVLETPAAATVEAANPVLEGSVADPEPATVAAPEVRKPSLQRVTGGGFEFDSWAQSLRARAEKRRKTGRNRTRGGPKRRGESPETEIHGESTAGGDVRRPGEAQPAGAGGSEGGSGARGQATAPAEVGTGGAGWRWINWVRRGYADGSLEANRDGGWLHNIEGDGFVVVPTCFEPFAEAEEQEVKTVRNQVARLKRHRMRGSVSGGAASLFRTELPDGRRVEGMLFPGELFWDDEGPPAVDVALRPRMRR